MQPKLALILLLPIVLLNFNVPAAIQVSKVKPRDSIQSTGRSRQLEQIAAMRRFVKLNANDYAKLRGRKLSLFEKISFKILQHRVKRMLKHFDYGEHTTLEKIAWFMKGFLLGPIGLLSAYLFLNDDDRELIKWVWFGFAAFVIVVGIILIVVI